MHRAARAPSPLCCGTLPLGCVLQGWAALPVGPFIFSSLFFSGEYPLKGPCLLGSVFLCCWEQRPGL